MEYIYHVKKRAVNRVSPNSILSGNKADVGELLNRMSNYTRKDKKSLKDLLFDVEIGDLKDFENFLRVFEYQLADKVNALNLNLVKKQAGLLTGSVKIGEIAEVQEQFEQDFVKYLQKNAKLKEIMQTYFKLLIKQLSTSNTALNVRVARVLKRLRKNLIINNWNKVLQNFAQINDIINENRQNLLVGGIELMKNESEYIKQEIGTWTAKNTGVVAVGDDTVEVATTQIDAYGDTVYCFVTNKGDYYEVSDDSHILFKLDPGKTDADLYHTGEQIALGAGFEFDEENCEIFVDVDKEDVAQAIIRLSQLQVAISYLG